MLRHSPKNDRWTGLSEVLRMAGPIMLGAVSFALMDFTDKIFVSRLGVEHLAAVGSSAVWVYTFALIFTGIAGCVAAFVGQSFGKGNHADCARFAWHGVYIAMGGGAVALILWPLAGPLFGSMNHPEQVTQLETAYFRIRIIGIVFMAWEVALSSFFQAISRPVVPMTVGVSANLLNVLLDYLLVFGKFGFPELGIEGAAWATVISLAFQTAVLHCVFVSQGVNKVYSSRSAIKFEWRKCRDLLRVGWPAGVSGFLDVFGWSIFTSFIVGSFGAIALAAHTSALNYMHLSFIPAMALGHASTAIVGQWIGRKDYDTAKARAFTAMKIGMTFMFIAGITFGVFGGFLMRAFSADPEVIRIGRILLILAAAFATFDAMTIVLIGALRGAGDTRWIMIVLTIGAYCFNLPLACLFAFTLGLGAAGAWIGCTIYVILLSGVVVWRFRSDAWRNIKIFSDDSPHAPAIPVAEIRPEIAK